MEQDALTFLLEKDDISWKTLLYDLVRTEQMNPWDIDITLLSKKYIQMIKRMRELDFRVSGKILLAAAILLKMKSQHLIEHGIDDFDRLLASTNEIQDEDPEFFSEFDGNLFGLVEKMEEKIEPHLLPRTPQPRQRKINIYDLANALQKAMEVKKRKFLRDKSEINVKIPEKEFDITEVIRQIHAKIQNLYKEKKSQLTFTHLLPKKPNKHDKVYTFIPLLHLDNSRKIDLLQKAHFKDIYIEPLK